MFDFHKCLEEGGSYLKLDKLESRLFLSKLTNLNNEINSSFLTDNSFINDIIDNISVIGNMYFDKFDSLNFNAVIKNSDNKWHYPGFDRRVFTIIMPLDRNSSINIKSRNCIFDESGNITSYHNENNFTATEDNVVIFISNLYGLEINIEDNQSYIDIFAK